MPSGAAAAFLLLIAPEQTPAAPLSCIFIVETIPGSQELVFIRKTTANAKHHATANAKHHATANAKHHATANAKHHATANAKHHATANF
ncbi:hypothetical protein AV530_010227 [Patagioenas fasciata monilis]|uniref:Secreted protein n=1 Tax=Patagioenas fasciata monilis TaxID=372326 RepID=A0A1V4L081_PATFA|nr:hypothetical protein AV530_010227 [Patagioenas fasciata monilis]